VAHAQLAPQLFGFWFLLWASLKIEESEKEATKQVSNT
jgi:hypothetical protein